MIVDTAERFDGRRIDRIGPMDLTVLATDCGSVPMNIGAVLKFDTAGGPSLAAVPSPPLRTSADDSRQRLRRVPFGCGRLGSARQQHRGPAHRCSNTRRRQRPTRRDHRLTRTNRELARASSAGPLGLAFRTLSRLRLFQTFIEHQRLVHTFETNMRCPTEPLCFGGHQSQP